MLQHAEVAHVLIRGLTKRTEPAGPNSVCSIEPVEYCVTWRSKKLVQEQLCEQLRQENNMLRDIVKSLGEAQCFL